MQCVLFIRRRVGVEWHQYYLYNYAVNVSDILKLTIEFSNVNDAEKLRIIIDQIKCFIFISWFYNSTNFVLYIYYKI